MALLLDGSNDYFTATAPNVVVGGNRTVMLWLKTTATVYSALFSPLDTGAFSGSTFEMGVSVPGIMYYYQSGSHSTAGSTYHDGAWHAVGYTIDASENITFYKDAVADGTGTKSPYVDPPTNLLGIGAWPDGQKKLAGTLSHICMWNTVLTSGQIADFFAGVDPATIAAANLQGYWKMPGGESPNVLDSSANAYHLTIVGAPTTASDPPVYLATVAAVFPPYRKV
jgi:hypothetical protein